MKKTILIVTFLVLSSFTQNDTDIRILQLGKASFKIGEAITGKAYFKTSDPILLKAKDRGYGGYNELFEWVSNSIHIRPSNKNNDFSEYTLVEQAIQIKNDTAYFSFMVPENLLKKSRRFDLKVERTWFVEGRDTTFIKKITFDVVK